MSAMGGVIPVRSPAEERGSGYGDEPGGLVIPLPVDHPGHVEPSGRPGLELQPISPELALIDPELARAARELLPDRPRFAAYPAVHPAPTVAEQAVVADRPRDRLEPVGRADLPSSPPPPPRPPRLRRRSDRARGAGDTGRRSRARPRSPSAADSGDFRSRFTRPERCASPEDREACDLRRPARSSRARADVRLGRDSRSGCLRVPAVPERRTHLPSARGEAATRAPRPLAAGWSPARAPAGRLPLVRLARLEPNEAPGGRCDRPGEAGNRKATAVIRARRNRRRSSTVLIGLTAALLVAARAPPKAPGCRSACSPSSRRWRRIWSLRRSRADSRWSPRPPRA